MIAIENPRGDSLFPSAQLAQNGSSWSIVRWLEYQPTERAFALDGRFASLTNLTVKWPSGTHHSFTLSGAGPGGDPARITLIGGMGEPSTVQGRLSCGDRPLRERFVTLRYAGGVTVSSITDDRGQFTLPALCIGDAEIYSSGTLGATPITVPVGGLSGLDFDLPNGEVLATFPGGTSSRHWVRLLIPEETLAALEEQSRRDNTAIDEAEFRAAAAGVGRFVGSRTVFEYVPAGRYQVIMIPPSRARTQRNLPSILARSTSFTVQENASITAPPCQE